MRAETIRARVILAKDMWAKDMWAKDMRSSAMCTRGAPVVCASIETAVGHPPATRQRGRSGARIDIVPIAGECA
ncbi:hypothetical protein ASG25_12210 [Rhizobium sp. Leaf384]|nr:hypothetical protein ASG25_12210 [Rhizobium sp. Leaf384]KQS82875.1 hypothetical protein ASG58_06025 [Rhizobium sp. Leaf383]